MSDTDSKTNRTAGKITVRETAELAVITALIIAGKEALNALPNIHPVMLILILCVKKYGSRAFFPAAAFSLVELLLYGLSIWTAPYLYIWIIAVAAALTFRKNSSVIFWSCFAGIYGLCFGLLSSLPMLVTAGIRGAFSYWIAGIGFDIIHCISNFAIVLVLYRPLWSIMCRIKDR